MTIALGLRCLDGLVLACDSLETDGITKRFVDKLWVYEVQDTWGIAIASAGESDLADSFTDGLKEILGNSDFDEVKLLAKLKIAIKSVRLSYPDSQFGFLAAVFGLPTLYSKLFRVLDESMHLGPVRRYQTLGIAGSLASFLTANLYRPNMCVEEGIRLAIFILAIAKENVNDCGGPLSVLSYGGIGKSMNSFTLRSKGEVDAIEKEFPASLLKDSLRGFWKEHNPMNRSREIDIQDGGGSRWIRQAKLNTKP